MEELAALTLIPGVGLLILSTSTRFIHLTSRAERRPEALRDQPMLPRRIRMLHAAMVSLYGAVCLIVVSTLMGRFAGVSDDYSWRDWPLTGAVVALLLAAQWLMRESFHATKVISVPEES